jgi:hypothetical protein
VCVGPDDRPVVADVFLSIFFLSFLYHVRIFFFYSFFLLEGWYGQVKSLFWLPIFGWIYDKCFFVNRLASEGRKPSVGELTSTYPI